MLVVVVLDRVRLVCHRGDCALLLLLLVLNAEYSISSAFLTDSGTRSHDRKENHHCSA